MREGWKCPDCGAVISPDVTEHRCGGMHEGLPRVPHYPQKWPPNTPYIGAPTTGRGGCGACKYGNSPCLCILGGYPVMCGAAEAPGAMSSRSTG